MFHVGGWQVMMSAFAVGGCFSHIGIFEATTALDQIERERVTVAMPAFELIWLSVLEHPRFAEADLSALRTVMNVGVPERMQRMQEMVPQAVQISMVGMTESMGSICIGSRSDSLHSRTHTSGRPLRGMEVRVIDPITGEECEPGIPGELLFRGVTRFTEYYRDPETTASVIDPEGWARTGDLVRREADGTVAFVSRLKDMLKVGGENASAAEIEGYLITHPAVAFAAVVAAPDARYGEVAAAFVVKTAGAEVSEEELIEYCMGSIATYKVPRYVRFVDEFPVSASQKIQKFVLRQQIEAELRERGVTEAPKFVSRR
jgi:fatty-acyl-CoA synthase